VWGLDRSLWMVSYFEIYWQRLVGITLFSECGRLRGGAMALIS
jgi:hypothetical protein